MNYNKYFVTAIGTDSGKTVVSAILTQALQADYWKPVQCGLPRDTDTVGTLINNGHCMLHPEAYLLSHPMSPHAAAALENTVIDLKKIVLPIIEDNPNLVIEGAGGLLVPLNDTDFVIDIAQNLGAQIILVCNLYLGSINHSILSINELKRRNLVVKGIIFNGEENQASEDYILQYSGYKCLLRLRPTAAVNQDFIQINAIKLFDNWND